MFEKYSNQIINFLLKTFWNDIGLLSESTSRSVRILETGIPIRDLNGKSLFLHYDIVDDTGEKVGAVRASGRGEALPPIDAIIIGEGALNPQHAQEIVFNDLINNYPGMQVTNLGFVCYGYPRIGLLHKLMDSTGGTQITLHDAFTGKLVHSIKGDDQTALASEAGQRDVEGEGVYSMEEYLPQSGTGAGARNQWAKLASLAQKSAKQAFGVNEESILPAVHGIYIPIRLSPQETPVYCAVATAQMMLAYLGIHLAQTEIAVALKTGPTGTTRINLAYGIERLVPSMLSSHSDSTVTFNEVYEVLRRSLPVKSGIPYHARLINGVRVYEFIEAKTGKVAFRDQYYLVNDPYPPGVGQFSMENAANPFEIFEDTLALIPNV